MSEKRIPLRKCIGCNEFKPKNELIRVIHLSNGQFDVDLTGKSDGRGAYVCNSGNCLELAMKNHGFDRSFKCKFNQETLERVKEIINE